MGKFLMAAVSAVALASAASSANAALIFFKGPTFPAIDAVSFADGVFGNDQGFGGFHGNAGTSGIGYTGYTNQYIQFNAPVTLNSLKLGGPCEVCNSTPVSFSINLYGPTSVLISSTLVTASSTPETVDFNQSGVEKVEFAFQGRPGTKAWYVLSDVSYDLSPGVPEPAVWSMMIAGFGLIGAGLRRHRTRTA